MECTAGAEPAVLVILRHAGELGVAGAVLPGAGDGGGQHAGPLQAHTLVGAQVDAAAVQERTVLLDLHAGDRRIADIDSIVTAKDLAGLGIELLVIEIVLAQDLACGVLTFEMDDQTGQRLSADVFEGEANRNFAGDVTFQQFYANKLDRAAGRLIVGAGTAAIKEKLWSRDRSHLLFTVARRAGP